MSCCGSSTGIWVAELREADLSPGSSEALCFVETTPVCGKGRLFVSRSPVRPASGVPADLEVQVWRYGDHPERVFYAQDGQNMFDASRVAFGTAWELDQAAARLVDDGILGGVMIVAVSSTRERLQDFAPESLLSMMPEKARQTIETAFDGPGRSRDYARTLLDEVMPSVRARFPDHPPPARTWLLGSSMGAVVSLETLSEHPETFAGAALLSLHLSFLPLSVDDPIEPTFIADVGETVGRWASQHLPPANGLHRFWIDASGQDIDRYYGCSHDALEASLVTLGYRAGRDFVRRTYPGVGHDEAAWRDRVKDALRFAAMDRGSS